MHMPAAVVHGGMSIPRMHARLDLAFSRTVVAASTPVICTIPDAVNECGDVMTDGCAGASSVIIAAGRGSVLEAMPIAYAAVAAAGTAAFQGRYGGYKGVWCVDLMLRGNVMNVRPSQLKLHISDDAATPSQREVEVITLAAPSGAACLNAQVAIILCDRGARAPLLQQLARETLDALDRLLHVSSVETCTPDCLAAAVAVLPVFPLRPAVLHAIGTMRTCPSSAVAACARASALLALQTEALRVLTEMRDRVYIPCARSRRAMLVPDPTGWLLEDEVYFQPSDGPPVRGRVVMCRNPCHARSDMVAPTAVSLLARALDAGGDAALAHAYEAALVDVIVISTRGRRPSLATRMSGGDFDGDDAWLCWDEGVLAAVSPSFEHETTAPAPSPRAPDPTAPAATPPASLQIELMNVYLRSLQDMTLGYATKLHLAWADSLLEHADAGTAAPDAPSPLQSRTCMHLARICARAVDAWKHEHDVVVPEHLRHVIEPHYQQQKGGTRTRHSASSIGRSFDYCQTRAAAIQAGYAAQEPGVLAVLGGSVAGAARDSQHVRVLFSDESHDDELRSAAGSIVYAFADAVMACRTPRWTADTVNAGFEAALQAVQRQIAHHPPAGALQLFEYLCESAQQCCLPWARACCSASSDDATSTRMLQAIGIVSALPFVLRVATERTRDAT